jgi:ketosteroid isomerase-like protein
MPALLLLLLALAAASRSAAAGIPGFPRGPKHEVRKEIEDLEDQWRDAMLNNNVAVMDRLMADDYTAITATGTIETKAQTLAARRAGTVRFQKLEVEDRHIRIYGNTAVVTSKVTLAGVNGQQPVDGRYRYTRVYTRNGSGPWKIVSFEASRLNGR